MATVTAVFAGVNLKTWSVVANDTETAVTITHGFAGVPAGDNTPEHVTLRPLAVEFYASQWIVASVSSTLIVLTKTNSTDAGSTDAQVLVQAFRPHSISK